MFLIDDFLFWIFKEIQKVAEGEMEDTTEKLKKELLEAQMLFETDQISEEEYTRREKKILERLNTLQEEQKKEE